MRRESPGIAEVASSLSMLVVTMAVLGGVGVVSLASLRSANNAVVSGSQQAASDAGLLPEVVATQANSTGSYIWLFNYGWVSSPLSKVFVNGGLSSGWRSDCEPLKAGAICSLQLAPRTTGDVTMFFGAKTISLSL